MALCHWPDCEVVCRLIVDRTNAYAYRIPTEQRMKSLGLGGIAWLSLGFGIKGTRAKHSNLEPFKFLVCKYA
jgi:hypothetical protein